MTQSQIILKVLKDNKKFFNGKGLKRGWMYGYDLIKARTAYGFLGTQADRRCRELAEIGMIDRDTEGRFVIYKHK